MSYELKLSLEVQQEFPEHCANEYLCEGCGDVPVKFPGDFCEECTTIIREDSLHEDPAKSHGRGGM